MSRSPDKKIRLCRALVAFLIALPTIAQAQSATSPHSHQLVEYSRFDSLQFLTETCRQWATQRKPASSLLPLDAQEQPHVDANVTGAARHPVGTLSYRWSGAAVNGLMLNVLPHQQRFNLQLGMQRPWFFLGMGGECELLHARQILYNQDLKPYKVIILDAALGSSKSFEWVNPPFQIKHGTVAAPGIKDRAKPAERVALIDAGVNYLLPEISSRLALDDAGAMLGYDFWDMDSLPFDAHPSRSPFFNSRHGTRTASIVLREAPEVELVAYRYPRPNMQRMRSLVEHAANLGVTIVAMPLGGNREDEWLEFYQVATEHPEMLFVVSAGNNGRDLSQLPVYPAVLPLQNMVVVTSSDDAVRPAERTNWGREFVHYMLPAEAVSATDFEGSPVSVSGSSYAVARMTAMLARLKMLRPEWNASDLIHELRRRYSDGAHPRYVSEGYIADPLAAFADMEMRTPVQVRSSGSLPVAASQHSRLSAHYRVSPIFYILHASWSEEQVASLVASLDETLAQCRIAVDDAVLTRLEVEDYLQDMQVGTARTLVEAIKRQEPAESIHRARPRVFLIRKTREINSNGEAFRFDAEAFGRANTRSRDWLRDSVWVSMGLQDAELALSHELMHVLMNSGSHSEVAGNLMNSFTSKNNTALNSVQCERAVSAGLSHGLLRKITR